MFPVAMCRSSPCATLLIEVKFEHYNIINYTNKEKHKLVHTIYRSLDRESNPRPLAHGNTGIEGTTTPTTKPAFNKIEGSMTRVVRSAPQYPARNTLVNHTTTKYFRSYSSTCTNAQSDLFRGVGSEICKS
jgi:hypothetical protein